MEDELASDGDWESHAQYDSRAWRYAHDVLIGHSGDISAVPGDDLEGLLVHMEALKEASVNCTADRKKMLSNDADMASGGRTWMRLVSRFSTVHSSTISGITVTSILLSS